MSLIPLSAVVTALDGKIPYNTPAGVSVQVSVLPPGVALVISIPPLTLVFDAAGVAELIAELSLLALEL